MALSDSIETTHASGIKIRVEWTATQNATNNTSSVTATAKLYYGYTISASAAKAVTLTINGQSFNWSLVLGTFSGWKTLGSRTVTVSHDVGGAAKSFTMAASCAIQVDLTWGYVGTVSTSGSGTLDALGSAFNFTVPSSVTADEMGLYNASGGDASTRFHLHFKLGSNPEYEVVNRVAGDIGFVVPLGWLPTQTSAAMTVTMRAYKAGALVGTITKTTTVVVASDVKPSVGTLSLSRTGQTTLAQYVQGKNGVTLSISSASAGAGSTLKEIIFTRGSYSATRSASTRSLTFSLPSAGTQNVSVKVVDRRGRSTTVSSSVVVRKYAPPRITSAEVYRCTSDGEAADNGTYARLKVGYALGVTTADLPGIAYSARTVKWGTTGSTNLAASGAWTAAFGDGGFSDENAYTLTVTVTDNLGGTATQVTSLSSLFVTMDFLMGGRGVSFGKVASEPDTLDVNWKIKGNGGLKIEDPTLEDPLLDVRPNVGILRGKQSASALVAIDDWFTVLAAKAQFHLGADGMEIFGGGLYFEGGLEAYGDSIFRGKIHAPAGFEGQRLPSGANLNAYTTPGVWYESSNASVAGMTNTPPTNYAGALVVLPGSTVIQYWHDYSTGTTGRVWRRRLSGGTWSSWEHYGGPVVGGNSANGYILHPGGIQICWYNTTITQAINGTYGGMYIGNHTWSFARNFTTAPAVSVGTFQWGSGASWGTCYAVDTSQAQLRGFDYISRAAGSTTIRATAIGYGVT